MSLNSSLRAIFLQNKEIAYALKRSRRRTIALSIDAQGLRVGAPLAASVAEIETLIFKHRAWIIEKLADWQNRPQNTLNIADGMNLPFLGAPLKVELAHGANRILWNELNSPQTLMLGLRDQKHAKALLEKAFREKARVVFTERLSFFAQAMRTTFTALTLSSAKTRWGCCNKDGEIRLNWKLIHFPLYLIDYVVIHELAHRFEMNHSAKFWAIVGAQYPDYKNAREAIKKYAYEIPEW